MGRWDNRKADRERVKTPEEQLLTKSFIFSCGFFAGMALVIFFG